jgi:hypothetical protein
MRFNNDPLLKKTIDNRQISSNENVYAVIQFQKSIAQTIPDSETLLTYTGTVFDVAGGSGKVSYDNLNTFTFLKAGVYRITRQDLFRLTVGGAVNEIVRLTSFNTSSTTISSIRHGNFENTSLYPPGSHTVANVCSFIIEANVGDTLTGTVSHSNSSITVNYANSIGSQRAFISMEYLGF